MAVTVKRGTTFSFADARYGETNGHEWGYVKIKADNPDSKDSLTVFITNAAEAKKWNGEGEIVSIDSFAQKNRKNKNTGKWETVFTINATVAGSDAHSGDRDSAFEQFMNLAGEMDAPPFA